MGWSFGPFWWAVMPLVGRVRQEIEFIPPRGAGSRFRLRIEAQSEQLSLGPNDELKGGPMFNPRKRLKFESLENRVLPAYLHRGPDRPTTNVCRQSVRIVRSNRRARPFTSGRDCCVHQLR